MDKEQFLLLKVMEECAEIQYVCSKAMQFGLDEIKQGQKQTNKERLEDEIEDLLNTIQLLSLELSEPLKMAAGIYDATSETSYNKKLMRLQKYKKYSHDLGKVSEPEV
jgi:hypothetical protein